MTVEFHKLSLVVNVGLILVPTNIMKQVRNAAMSFDEVRLNAAVLEWPSVLEPHFDTAQLFCDEKRIASEKALRKRIEDFGAELEDCLKFVPSSSLSLSLSLSVSLSPSVYPSVSLSLVSISPLSVLFFSTPFTQIQTCTYHHICTCRLYFACTN